MTSFTDKILRLHQRLDRKRIPHALGGAIALGYCTGDPRATADIDVNIFVSPDEADPVFAALPPGITVTDEKRALAVRDGQVRLWWDETPVDLFFAYHEFHERAADRVRMVPLGDVPIPVLACTDLAVFKAFFNRGRDWVDLEAMAVAGTIDGPDALGWLARLLGRDDERYEQLAAILANPPIEPTEFPRLDSRGSNS